MSRGRGSKAQLHAALLSQHGADAIVDFSGAKGFLSNFYLRALTLEGVTYATAEHAFQAQKSTCPAERMRIARAPGQGAGARGGQRRALHDALVQRRARRGDAEGAGRQGARVRLPCVEFGSLAQTT